MARLFVSQRHGPEACVWVRASMIFQVFYFVFVCISDAVCDCHFPNFGFYQ